MINTFLSHLVYGQSWADIFKVEQVENVWKTVLRYVCQWTIQ